MGVDLVAMSGGKGIRGPQASGLLFGKRDLIAAAALNHFTPGHGAGYVTYAQWAPPPTLVSKEKLRGLPHHPIGRGLKVSREAVIGLLTALQIFADEERNAKEMKKLRLLLEPIVERLQGISGVEIERNERPLGGFPVLNIRIDRSKVGRSAAEILQRLREGKPPIYFFAKGVEVTGEFTVISCSMNEEQARIVAERLYTAVTR
jgi:L-seryl-tRNA(Ser) seleniumtransferase